MQAGLLTGSFTIERAKALPKDDWRSRNAEYQGDKLIANLKLAEAFKPIAGRYNTTIASAALAWTLAWPGVTGAIVGARNATQINGWIDAAKLELNKEDMAEIGAALQVTGAGTGPIMPPS